MRTKNNAGSAADADDDMDEAPILTEEDAADVEVFEGNTFVRRGRGRPPTGDAKEVVSFRLDRDVVAKLREAGPGWQSQVNPLLREVYIHGAKVVRPVDDTVDRHRREQAARKAV